MNHCTTASTWMMFSSPVRMRLSSSKLVVLAEPVRNPISTVFCAATFGVSTLPIGAGQFQCRPGSVKVPLNLPNISGTPRSAGCT